VAKPPPRFWGLVLLAGSVGSTLIHRTVYEAARHGPAQAAEFGLALLTFILAGTGVLLLIHGARLFAPVPHGDRLAEIDTGWTLPRKR
jgi:hypothetical protein